MSLKKVFKILALILILAFFILALSPIYLQKGLIHWYANIDDYKIFYNDTIKTDTPEDWKISHNYNSFKLSNADLQYFEDHKTVAYLIIQNSEIIYEKYWDGYSSNSFSNIFSSTKSIVSILIGIAIEEGFINDVNDKIGEYIPEFANDERGDISIKNLLTMSSGLDWVESYTSPISVTAKSYYGAKLRTISTSQNVVQSPGKIHKYQSGNTQLLGFILENATQKTITDYAEEKLWKPLGMTLPALWTLDKKNGDERAFCCLYTNVRDIAKIGQLILNKGKWDNKQIIPISYLSKMLSPATYLTDFKTNKPCDFYGFQWWLLPYEKLSIPYMRGHRGQYVYIIPEKNAVIVRFGKKKAKKNKDIPKYVEIGLKVLDGNQ